MTKREITLVALTAAIMCIPMAIIARYKQKPIMTSSVFEWNDFKATKTAVGEVRQVFDAPTKTINNLECHITTLNPGQLAHAAHQHVDEEILIVKEGNVEALVNGQLKHAGPGSIIFQASNILHSIRNVGTTPSTYYVLKFTTQPVQK
jgi:quercetin dioxygenase-like cupin family protein